MADAGLKDLCFALVAGQAERFLELQWSDGRFAGEPERETDEWDFYQQQFILPAALLWVSDRQDNRWRGDGRLWQAILRNGRHLVERIAEDGSMTWRLGGVVLGRPFVCQRLTCAWLLAYQMLKARLPAEDAELWRTRIEQACAWLVAHHLLPHQHVTRFTSHDVGTGTNHFALYLSLVWRAGVEFGRAEWTDLATGLMRRLIADQRPGGYWEEHQGPALGYNYLTYHGVEEYTAWSGDDIGMEALRRGLELHRHWTYPDGVPVECIDGRMRHLSGPMLWGLSGFTRWPEGRGYARLLLGRVGRDGALPSGETVARIAEAYLLLHEGEEAPAPQSQASYRHELDGNSVVRKAGPWVAALSGQCSPPWPENQFCLDRQALVSIWHQDAGLVVDGSNSKFQPELATFCRGAGREADHMPVAARLASSGEEERVVCRYPSFGAEASIRIISAQALEVRPRAAEGVTATIVPNVGRGERLRIEGVGERELADDSWSLTPEQHQGRLYFRGVTMRLPEQTTIAYPVSPFNSYSADNTSPPSANRLVVRWPAAREAILRIEIRGGE